jgi:hypothetical protein
MNLYTRERKRKKETIQLVRGERRKEETIQLVKGERRKERTLKEMIVKYEVISHNQYHLGHTSSFR